MRRLPTIVSLFTILFFIFSLTGNVLIADPAFTSMAFAQKGKKAKKLKGKELTQAVIDLQAETTDLQNQINTIELTPGPQGDQGIQGVAGAKGDKGDTGDQGIQGVAGAKGDKGDTGDQGIQGVAGAKGDKGDTGDQGIQGVAGAKGDKGDTGDQGIQGVAGTNGTGVIVKCGVWEHDQAAFL
jgi:hypothetical protein